MQLVRKTATIRRDFSRAFSALNAVSPVDGRYASQVDALRGRFSEYALIKQRVKTEIHWFTKLAEHEAIKEVAPLTPDGLEFLQNIVQEFSERDGEIVKDIEKITNHDVKAVEYYLKERFAQSQIPELVSSSEFIHFACTSEDINNVSYALMIKDCRDNVLLPEMNKLIEMLRGKAHQFADTPMMSRTHGQPASPTTVGKEIANFAYRLQRQADQLTLIPITAKMNGQLICFV